jgi:hypothetical protein
MSRAARLTLSATAWIALGSALFFLVTTEQKIAGRRTALRAFDLRARDASFTLGEVRAGQQAYVAAGQSPTFWVPKVAALMQEVAASVDMLRGSAASSAAGQALLDAAAAVTEFGSVDRRVRDYLHADEALMASDVVFSEGGDAAGRAARQIETARIAEYQTFDADEGSRRRLEAYAGGAAAGLAALILAILGFARTPAAAQEVATSAAPVRTMDADELLLTHPALGRLRATAPEPPPPAPSTTSSTTLKAAAELCTEFGRMHDLADLKILLGRAARLLDANGLVVWLGNAAGADLQPVLAHGYSDPVLALIRPVSRTADNAAAAAYRSSVLQVVTARPGVSLGAVVAPLLSAEGCIGALTAEIRNGSEQSPQIQSLASILAAQLAGVLSAASSIDASSTKAAAS